MYIRYTALQRTVQYNTVYTTVPLRHCKFLMHQLASSWPIFLQIFWCTKIWWWI